jgi:hypothetical protein
MIAIGKKQRFGLRLAIVVMLLMSMVQYAYAWEHWQMYYMCVEYYCGDFNGAQDCTTNYCLNDTGCTYDPTLTCPGQPEEIEFYACMDAFETEVWPTFCP